MGDEKSAFDLRKIPTYNPKDDGIFYKQYKQILDGKGSKGFTMDNLYKKVWNWRLDRPYLKDIEKHFDENPGINYILIIDGRFHEDYECRPSEEEIDHIARNHDALPYLLSNGIIVENPL